MMFVVLIATLLLWVSFRFRFDLDECVLCVVTGACFCFFGVFGLLCDSLLFELFGYLCSAVLLALLSCLLGHCCCFVFCLYCLVS